MCRRIVVLLTVMVAALAGAEVHMKDGRVLEGRIVADNESHLHLLVESGRASGVLHLPRDRISRIDPGPSERQQRLVHLERELADALQAEDVERLWQLAEAFEELDRIRFREVARLVADRDRHHEGAHRALGLERHRGVWMAPHEAALAEGRYWHEGRWMDWGELRAALIADAESRERVRERREEQAERRRARRQRQRDPYALAGPVPVPVDGYGGASYLPYRSSRSLLYGRYGGFGFGYVHPFHFNHHHGVHPHAPGHGVALGGHHLFLDFDDLFVDDLTRPLPLGPYPYIVRP